MALLRTVGIGFALWVVSVVLILSVSKFDAFDHLSELNYLPQQLNPTHHRHLHRYNITFIAINLKESRGRLQSVKQQFALFNLPLTVFETTRVVTNSSLCGSSYEFYRGLTEEERSQIRLPGFENFDGTIGTFLSHLEIWRRTAVASQPSIVFEDDVLLKMNILDAFDLIEKTNLEYLNLGADMMQCFDRLANPQFYNYQGRAQQEYKVVCMNQKFNHSCGNFGGGNIAYYLTPSGAQKLLRHYETYLMYDAADWFVIHFSKTQPLQQIASIEDQSCLWRALLPGVVGRVAWMPSERIPMKDCRGSEGSEESEEP